MEGLKKKSVTCVLVLVLTSGLFLSFKSAYDSKNEGLKRQFDLVQAKWHAQTERLEAREEIKQSWGTLSKTTTESRDLNSWVRELIQWGHDEGITFSQLEPRAGKAGELGVFLTFEGHTTQLVRLLHRVSKTDTLTYVGSLKIAHPDRESPFQFEVQLLKGGLSNA